MSFSVMTFYLNNLSIFLWTITIVLINLFIVFIYLFIFLWTITMVVQDFIYFFCDGVLIYKFIYIYF